MTDATAAEVLQTYVASQVRSLVSRRQAVIEDTPGAVHKSRVSTRRLRSLLRTFRDVLDAEQTEPLRAELRWWADVLGAPRDAEVQRDKLIAAVEALHPQWRRGPVVARIRHELDEAHRVAHAALVGEMDGPRARALIVQLEAFSEHLPVSAAAHGNAADVLLPRVAKACRRVDRAARLAEAADGLERLHWWHEARKKAKAARYAGDALADVFGEPAEALAAAYTQVTEAFGELQDSVVSAARLRTLAHLADAAGESTVTYWHLVELEREHAAAQEEAGRAALAAVEEAGVRAWLEPVPVNGD